MAWNNAHQVNVRLRHSGNEVSGNSFRESDVHF